MPTHIEQELGIAPTTNRIRRWFRKHMPNKGMSLDPLTVNYETWRAMSKNIRRWPSYQEAPNYVEVLVSPEDWDDYWCVDTSRKEAGISAYVKARIADKGIWIAGEPQVFVFEDDTIEQGDFEIVCQFAEPMTAEELAQQRESMRRVPTYNNPSTMTYPVAATNLLPANASVEWDSNVYMGGDADVMPQQPAQMPTYDSVAPVMPAMTPIPAPLRGEDPVREVEVREVEVRAVDVITVAEDAVDVESVDVHDEPEPEAPYVEGPEVFDSDESDEPAAEVPSSCEADELDESQVEAPITDGSDEPELEVPDKDVADELVVEDTNTEEPDESAEEESHADEADGDEGVAEVADVAEVEALESDKIEEVSQQDDAAGPEGLVGEDEESDGLADGGPEQELNLAQELVEVFWEQDADEEQPLQDADPAPVDEAASNEDADSAEADEAATPLEEEPVDQDATTNDEQEQVAGIDIELSALDLPAKEPASDQQEDRQGAQPEQASEQDLEPELNAEPDPESAPYSAFDQSFEYDSDLDDDLDAEPLEVLVPSSEPASAAHYVDPENPGYLYLIGKSEFRLEVHSGDCIGAVRLGESVPEQVNVRLDADGFPYAEVMQCTIDVQNGRWCVTNHAAHGTRLTKATGERFVLGKPAPCPLDPDDILWLGHERPLRVEY